MAKPDKTESIPSTQLNRRFGALIADLLRGKSFTVTRNGVPVCRLVPIESTSKSK